jgi:hypothetical protein
METAMPELSGGLDAFTKSFTGLLGAPSLGAPSQ